jgi:hypothetical protein
MFWYLKIKSGIQVGILIILKDISVIAFFVIYYLKMLSKNEGTNMILIFAECQKNSVSAENLYIERYPERRVPTDKIFRNVL